MKISSGSPFEALCGLSRARRVGNVIAVSGTAPLGPDGKTVHVDDVYGQTKRCLDIMRDAIEAAGGRLDQVTRTRVMLCDMERWRDAARAHVEIFGEHGPASTFVEVNQFIDPEWLVETEADCVVT